MKNFIPTPTISEILTEEFLKPLDISAYRLARDIAVPVNVRLRQTLRLGLQSTLMFPMISF